MGSKGRNKNKTKAQLQQKGEPTTSSADGAQVSGSHRNGGKIITDARFASVHSDPRFREMPRQKSKVAIDSRFDRMFTDKNFAASKARIDKRGRKRKESENSLKHYYRLEEEELEKEKQRKQAEELKSEESESDESQSQSEESEESETEELENKSKVDLDGDSEESEEDEDEAEEEEEQSDDTASTSSTDSDEENGVVFEEEDTYIQEENVPEIDKETHRLAVVNMDWSEVKASDLYMLLSSFLPKGGQIMSVAVYPSEFGLKRMEEEALHGPVGLFDDEKNKKENSDDDDEDDEEIANEKLRAYELSRMRYYYAVVECDSIATADYIYKTCDGVEFERSSNKLDLRFIPDSMEFKHPPRDVAKEAPANYEGVDFHSRALQHSKINLTWDEDEPHRAKTLKRKFNADQLAELELKEFLASDESDSEENGNGSDTEDESSKKRKKQDMYRALIESGDGSDGNVEDDGQEMEVTFNTGLEDISKRILEKKDKKSETVWEAYLRKKKEKKKSRKNRSKSSSEDESSGSDQEPVEEPDDFFIEEPSGNGKKDARDRSTHRGNQKREMSEEAEASRAQLELLLADDNGTDTNLKGYNLKPKKAKGKKGKEILEEGKIPTADYDDPRFSVLFTSPLYALDPTDPQFKRSAAYARQMAQKQQKADQDNLRITEDPDTPQAQVSDVSDKLVHVQPDELPSKRQKHELSSLVRSIKMKSKQIPLPSHNVIVGKNKKSKVNALRKKQ